MIKYKEIIIILLLILSGVCGFIISLYQHSRVAAISGHTEETFHYPVSFVKQLTGDPHAGEKIFKEYCLACHSPQPLIDVKAPPVGDKKAWEIPRKMGMDALLKITTRGKGAMPSRGGCFECSDAQLQETIQYMLNYK